MASQVKISQATVLHLAAIAAIADAVAFRSTQDLDQGFLLGAADAAELSALIEAGEIWVAEFAEATVGFAVAHPDASPRFSQFIKRLPDIQWSEAPTFLDSPAVYIDRIATRPSHRRHGIGRKLYEALFADYRSRGFFAGIAEAPTRNDASIRFHYDLGFRRVGTFGPACLGSFDHYVGGVYFRNPA
jgi:ribosomal protein S18 acetylase RimI-like enzyme